jgi:hypothetical protein
MLKYYCLGKKLLRNGDQIVCARNKFSFIFNKPFSFECNRRMSGEFFQKFLHYIILQDFFLKFQISAFENSHFLN